MSGHDASGRRTTTERSADRRTVFVSYDGADIVVAQKLRTCLEDAGFPCYLPTKTANVEESSASVKQAIDASSCLVLILSDRSNQSGSVREEVEAAYRQGKPIFPLRIEQTLPSAQLELFVSAKHWIDAWQGTIEVHAARLARELAGEAAVHATLPSSAWYRQRRWQHPALALTVAAAAAVAINAFLAEERLPELPDDSYAASFGFTGGYILPGKPNEVTFSVRDAHTKGSFAPIGALAHMRELEVYNITAPAGPLLVYKAEAANFSGQYGASLGHKLSFEGLPALLVTCLSYQRSDAPAYETVLQTFGFIAGGKVYGHASFDSVSIGKKRVLRADVPVKCASALGLYIDKDVDRSEFAEKVRAAIKPADTVPSLSNEPSPKAPPTPPAPAPLSPRDNIVGTLVLANAFNKSFCRGAAFAVAPNVEGVAEFRRRNAVTDAELQAATAVWEPKLKTLDAQIAWSSCTGLLENYVAHGLVVRTSSAPLTDSPAMPAVAPR